MKIKANSRYVYRSVKGRNMLFTVFPPFGTVIKGNTRQTGNTLLTDRYIQNNLKMLLKDFSQIIRNPESRETLLNDGYYRYNRDHQKLEVSLLSTLVMTRRNGIKGKRKATSIKVCSIRDFT